MKKLHRQPTPPAGRASVKRAPAGRASAKPRGRPTQLPFDAALAIQMLAERDPDLGRIIERAGAFELRLRPHPTPYEALAESILYQQISGHAAAAILGRVREQLGQGRFPSPETIAKAKDTTLRGVGLSRMKSLALRDLAARTLDGTLPSMAQLRRMEDEAIVERLTVVRGIGRWTAEMFLIFRLGRPDVLPVLDYGVRKGFQRAFGMKKIPHPITVTRRGERWRPYRTVASWYLWRAADLKETDEEAG
jgi:3-methyladenine DNA glycosylase/8-oxoguanine DNA glycosylase